MSVEEEIRKTKLKYHSKKGEPQKQEVAVTRASVRKQSIKDGVAEYITIFLNIMKRDIMIKLGINKENEAKKIQMKEDYDNFMERFF